MVLFFAKKTRSEKYSSSQNSDSISGKAVKVEGIFGRLDERDGTAVYLRRLIEGFQYDELP
jgi:aminoglycoside/choline kinase family phosphotransferase